MPGSNPIHEALTASMYNERSKTGILGFFFQIHNVMDWKNMSKYFNWRQFDSVQNNYFENIFLVFTP